MSKSLLPHPHRDTNLSRRGLLAGAVGLAAAGLAAGPARATGPSIYRSSGGGVFNALTRPAPGPLFGPGQEASPWRGPTEFGLGPRTIGLRHAHTGERVDTTFWQRGGYDQLGVARLNAFMRDWRTDEIIAIDPTLYDVLWSLGQSIGRDPEFTVLSAYRSRATNDMLIRTGHTGVARDSLHIQGKAVDITLPGFPISGLHDAALALQAGGVGYYPSSNFVHIDTGRFRTW
ncbi:MAG: DUF882 domain-containing protein [Alphaproteobacteria bacterium]